MDKGKLKVLIMALKEIVDELESEIYSDPDSYKNSHAFSSPYPAICQKDYSVTPVSVPSNQQIYYDTKKEGCQHPSLTCM